jgi:hypothetical protein
MPGIAVVLLWIVLVIAGCVHHGDVRAGSVGTGHGNSDAPLAAAEASPDAPEICRQLVASPEIKTLHSAIAALASGNKRASAVEQLRAAAATLGALQADGSLRAALDRTQRAVERLAEAGLRPDVSQQVAQAFQHLGEEVQTVCHFPVG